MKGPVSPGPTFVVGSGNLPEDAGTAPHLSAEEIAAWREGLLKRVRLSAQTLGVPECGQDSDIIRRACALERAPLKTADLTHCILQCIEALTNLRPLIDIGVSNCRDRVEASGGPRRCTFPPGTLIEAAKRAQGECDKSCEKRVHED